jgi:hypothetical protein
MAFFVVIGQHFYTAFNSHVAIVFQLYKKRSWSIRTWDDIQYHLIHGECGIILEEMEPTC